MAEGAEGLTTLFGLRGASLWLAVGGMLTFFGGFIALVGGIVAVVGAVRNSAEQEEMILGGQDTFCQLAVYASEHGWYLSTFHAGPGGAIYDVQVVLHEVYENGTLKYDRERHDIGTMTSNTWPYDLGFLNIPVILTPNLVVNTAPRYFEAQVTQRNGTAVQSLVIYPKADGRIEFGFLRLEFNGKPRKPDFKLAHPRSLGIEIPAAEVARIATLRGGRL